MWFEMNLGREMAVAPSKCLFLYRSKSPHNVSFFATPVAVTSWGVCCDTIRRLRLGFRTGPLSDPHCSLTDPWGGAFRENLSFDSGIAPERLQRVGYNTTIPITGIQINQEKPKGEEKSKEADFTPCTNNQIHRSSINPESSPIISPHYGVQHAANTASGILVRLLVASDTSGISRFLPAERASGWADPQSGVTIGG